MRSRMRDDNFVDKGGIRTTPTPDGAAGLRMESTTSIEATDLGAVCGRIVDAALQLLDADCASIQTTVAARSELQLLAARGFTAEATAFWQRVDAGSSSCCGQALRRRERIVIADVEQDETLAGTEDLRHLRLCGIRAVQSTPLVSPGGEAVGVLSTHWRREYQPPQAALRSLDAVALLVADLLGHALTAEALRRSDAALRCRIAALEQTAREKNEFLAMLAHELRNPLAPIRNVGEVLVHLLHDHSAARRPLAILKRQTQQLTRLVDDLLDISRLERNRLTLEERPVEIGDVLDQAIETVQPLIREQGHRLTVERAAAPVFVLGDRARLIQCVGNLLHNAAKYTERGGEIRIGVRDTDTRVSIEVSDNGAGIPGDLLPHIFDLFVQSEETLANSRGGLGIGLAIVKRLVEMHGGSVEAASPSEGGGSSFTIHLWRLELPPGAPSGAPPQAHAGCVLVVDANADAADTIAAILKATGRRAEVAYSALSALAAAERLKPDAVLLDLELPRMNGYELARRLRAQPALCETLLIAMGSREDERAARAAGFDEHLTKPVDVATLERVLALTPTD